MKKTEKNSGITFIAKPMIKGWKSISFKCPVTEILRVCTVTVGAHLHIVTNSPPGHTFQYVKNGSYENKVNGIIYKINAGNIVYMGSSEIQEVTAGKEGFELISVIFTAPSLEPLPPEMRVFRGNKKIERIFKDLLDIYTNKDKSQEVIIYHTLLGLLIEIYSLNFKRPPRCSRSGKWWEVEEFIRRNRAFRISVKEICENFNINKTVLSKLCVEATGAPPAKRIQSIRMAEARGLLLYSESSVSTVAEKLGYPRIHEFSREFTNFFGYSPKEFVDKDRDILESKSTKKK